MENAEKREKDQARERSVLRRPISVRMVAAPRRRLRRYRDRLAISIYTKQWLSIDFAISPSKFSSSFLLLFILMAMGSFLIRICWVCDCRYGLLVTVVSCLA